MKCKYSSYCLCLHVNFRAVFYTYSQVGGFDLVEVISQGEKWVAQSEDNARVVAAHEGTQFLHQAALLGVISAKDVLPGNEERGEPNPVEWGRIHRLGPIREFSSYHWTSEPVYVGDTNLIFSGAKHEFMSLDISGTLETRTDRSLSGLVKNTGFAKSEQLRGGTCKIVRLLGNDKHNPDRTIPRPDMLPVRLETGYTHRDVRKFLQWSPQEMVEDCTRRCNEISAFMAELAILTSSMNDEYEIYKFTSEHVSRQLKAIDTLDKHGIAD